MIYIPIYLGTVFGLHQLAILFLTIDILSYIIIGKCLSMTICEEFNKLVQQKETK